MNYLAEYQTFTTTAELNEATSAHLERHNCALNETERSVFLMLTRYAVKFPGVAHLKTETIASAIGKTGRTIRRAIKTLVDLGVIEKLEFMRAKSGGYGANIFRICPLAMSTRQESAEPMPAPVEDSSTQNETISLKKSKPSNTLDTPNNISDIVKRGLLAKLPTEIGQTLGVFFNTDDIHRLYGVMLRAKSSIGLSSFEAYEDEYNTTLISVLSAWKRGKVRSLDAVLYEATKRTARRLMMTERGLAAFGL